MTRSFSVLLAGAIFIFEEELAKRVLEGTLGYLRGL